MKSVIVKRLGKVQRRILFVVFLVPFISLVIYAIIEMRLSQPCMKLDVSEAIPECKAALESRWLFQSSKFNIKKRLTHLQVSASFYADAMAHLNEIVASGSATYFDYSNRGNAHYWQGHYEEAVADFQVAHKLRPKNAEAFSDLIASLIEIKDYNLALAFAKNYSESNEEDVIGHRLLAETYYYSEEYLLAKQSIIRAFELDKEDPSTLNLQGLILEALDEFDAAQAAYDKALLLSPDTIKFRRNRAYFHSYMQNYTLAKADFLEILKTDRNTLMLNGLALVHIELNEPEAALALLNESERTDPTLIDTLYTRGRYFILSNNNQAARDVLQQVRRKDPEHRKAKYYYAISLYNLEQYTDALALFEELAKAWPSYSAVQVDIADCLYSLGRYANALAPLSKAIELNAESGHAFTLRARVNNELKNWDAAVADATKAISIHKDNAQAHYVRAYSNWRLQKLEETRADYDKAHVLAPDRFIVEIDRADFMLFQGRVDEARSAIVKMTNSGRKSAYLTRLLGRLAEYDGKFLEALKLYHDAQREDSSITWIVEDIAYAQLANNQPAMALITCDEMLVKLPHAEESHRCRAKALMRMGLNNDALAALDKAIELRPQYWSAILDKASVLIDLQQFDQAVEILKPLAKDKRGLDMVHYYLALAYENSGQPEFAIREYSLALPLADKDFAKSIASRLNRLRSKQPALTLPSDLLYPQSNRRR